MVNIHKTISKDDLLEFIREAKILVGKYNKENSANPKYFFNYGCVDDVVLRLLEHKDGFVTTGVKLYGRDGRNIKMYGRSGHLAADGTLYAFLDSVSYTLVDYTGTTVSRFARSLCNIIARRSANGNPDLREIMNPQGNVVAKTRNVVEPYSLR